MRKVLRLLAISGTLTILLMFALTGSVFAGNGHGVGDGTGPCEECTGPWGPGNGHGACDGTGPYEECTGPWGPQNGLTK